MRGLLPGPIRKITVLSAVLVLALAVLIHPPIYAAGVCSATVSPTTVTPTSGTNFTISVTNTGSADIQWIDLTVPSGNFSYAGNSISGWSTADHGDGTTLSGAALGQGQAADFPVLATTDVVDAAAANWHVQASYDAGGANPTTCDGTPATAISGNPPNDSENGVSNIVVTGITASSATITWDSDNPMSSLAYYGQTSGYGTMSAYSQSLETSHSLTLTALRPATGYHFQVAGSDGQGNYAYSADNTFLTDVAANNSKSLTSASHSVIVGATDAVPPQITVSTKLVGAYKKVPAFTGTASDNKAVAQVDYSTDGGKNWLPADILLKAGQSKVTFAFTPLLPQDGNYDILARATDSAGNTTTTASQILVIDRLPPLVGGNIVNVGPQIMQPSSDGTIQALVGVDQKITLSAIGGATAISLQAATTVKTKTGAAGYTQTFSLTASEDTGLWSGIVGFNKPGVYTLTAKAVDGAGNKTSRLLNSVYVSSPGRTVGKTTGKPIAATVTLYYLEPQSHTWVVWDAAAFGQKNPQKTGHTGTFSLFLPPGKYYVQAAAPGYHTLVSSIVTAGQPTPLTAVLRLSRVGGPHIGGHYLSFPSLSVQHIDTADSSPKNVSQASLVGKQAPDFSLSDTTGATIHAADLLGRPTLISFDPTWSPTTAEQLASLSALQTNPDLNVIPVALQESSDRAQAYTAMTGLRMRWLVDPDSTLSASYNVQSLPMHYFIDRMGIIRKVVVGVMSKQQMLTSLSGL